MSNVASQFYKDNDLHSIEGRQGLECLALLCGALGYRDIGFYGQFVHQTPTGMMSGQTGDIFEFLENNPGAIAAIMNWIDDQNIPEWDEIVEDECCGGDDEEEMVE